MTKVLVVDDDKDLLEMVSLVLTNHDMQVTPLERCLEFQDYLEADRPDIVLMDIYLGDCDGRDLCQNLKKSEPYSNLPVILYSAGNISAESVRKSQANSFMTKPFDITQLVSRIREHVLPKSN